ncbi:hypothetical protein EIP91_007119, partial [Steccherinum ochraceum]
MECQRGVSFFLVHRQHPSSLAHALFTIHIPPPDARRPLHPIPPYNAQRMPSITHRPLHDVRRPALTNATTVRRSSSRHARAQPSNAYHSLLTVCRPPSRSTACRKYPPSNAPLPACESSPAVVKGWVRSAGSRDEAEHAESEQKEYVPPAFLPAPPELLVCCVRTCNVKIVHFEPFIYVSAHWSCPGTRPSPAPPAPPSLLNPEYIP